MKKQHRCKKTLLISFQKCWHFAWKCHGSDSIVNVGGCGVALVWLIVLTTLYSGGTQSQGLYSECLGEITGRVIHSSYQTHNGDLTIIIPTDVVFFFTVILYPHLKSWSWLNAGLMRRILMVSDLLIITRPFMVILSWILFLLYSFSLPWVSSYTSWKR